MKYILSIILALQVSVAMAADERWSMKSFDDVRIANTSNDTGSTVGVLCNETKAECLAYVKLNIDCTDKGRYPMMINSSVGSFPLMATCSLFEKEKYLVIDEFDSAVEAFESGGEIGFATPMESGQFKVSRFKTLGATAAIKEARRIPPGKSKKTSEQSL